MKNKLLTVFTALIFTLSTTYLFAGSFNVGVIGSMNSINADGSEVEGGENHTATASHDNVFLGSVYGEYEYEGFAVGIEFMPGAADVSDKVKERTETPLSITGTAATQSTEVTRKAQAEVEDYTVLYVEAPIYGNAFIKLGMAQVDVNTTENLGSNSGSYGNATLDGINYGIGVKGSMSWNDSVQYKLYFEKTRFDTLSLKSSGNSVAAEYNTITADLDVSAVKFGLGYRF